jgi:hypothetical protein
MNIKKTPVVLAMLLVGVILSISPSFAGTIFQNFTNNSFNTKYFWLNTNTDPSLPSVAVANNRLEFTVPATSQFGAAGLQLLDDHQLTGNYDVQVDFNMLNWPANNGVQAGFVTIGYEVARVNSDFGQGAQDAYMVYFAAEQVQGQPTVFHVVTTPDTSGRLRLSRTGNTISGYYLHNNAWQLIASYTNSQQGAPTSFYVGGYVGNRSITQITEVAFDNLQVTNKVFPSALAPLNLLLQN